MWKVVFAYIYKSYLICSVFKIIFIRYTIITIDDFIFYTLPIYSVLKFEYFFSFLGIPILKYLFTKGIYIALVTLEDIKSVIDVTIAEACVSCAGSTGIIVE